MAEVSDRLYLGRIVPGMDVCDVTGDKVGTIAHVYRFDESEMEGSPARSGEEILEIKHGFLGLGKHYYVPISAVQEVLTDSVFLSKPHEAFGELGYEEKPAHFDQLH
jgi:hypothetical protein